MVASEWVMNDLSWKVRFEALVYFYSVKRWPRWEKNQIDMKAL
jgi:hypothetical protein